MAVGTGGVASFQWQPPLTGDAPTGYLLEAGTSASGAEIAVVPVSGLSFATPAPPGSYYVRVRAQNACGTGPASPTSGTVAPGGSRTVTVFFEPLAAVTYGGTLTVVSDATAGTASIAVSGTGYRSSGRKPVLLLAASTRRALVAGQWLTPR